MAREENRSYFDYPNMATYLAAMMEPEKWEFAEFPHEDLFIFSHDAHTRYLYERFLSIDDLVREETQKVEAATNQHATSRLEFCDSPAEIRRMIWMEVAKQPRLIEVTNKFCPTGTTYSWSQQPIQHYHVIYCDKDVGLECHL